MALLKFKLENDEQQGQFKRHLIEDMGFIHVIPAIQDGYHVMHVNEVYRAMPEDRLIGLISEQAKESAIAVTEIRLEPEAHDLH